MEGREGRGLNSWKGGGATVQGMAGGRWGGGGGQKCTTKYLEYTKVEQ